jgi:3-oxoacyl-[acyl-carrier protein] reductase
MGDFLVDLGTNPLARQIVSSLGLPLPLPEKLRRTAEPWEDRPIDDQKVTIRTSSDPVLTARLADAVTRAGATPSVVGDDAATKIFGDVGYAWGRPSAAEGSRANALVFDATDLEGVSSLAALFEFFQPRVRSLARSGRVVIIGRPAGANPASALVSQGLEGFMRSLAKEIGRLGATANLIHVDHGAEHRLEPVLRWLLSARSAFVTGQSVRVSDRVADPGATPFRRPLDGRVALVTGAARGIGEATAKALAREGAHVVVLDRPADDAPAAQVARDVGGTLLLADLGDPGSADLIRDALRDRFGRVDVVVHNAGITRDKTLANMDADRFLAALDINLGAPVRLTQALDGLLSSGARVIALASIAGIAGNFGQTNYATAKAGVIGWVGALSEAYAARGIAVNAVAPGFIETRLTAAIPAATREGARRLSALSQGGLPSDVAEAITFLASPGGKALSGQVLRVCGGSFVGR